MLRGVHGGLMPRLSACWRLHDYKRKLLERRTSLYPVSKLHCTHYKYSQHKDYYRILGLDKDAKPQEIKAAYIEAVKIHHPDSQTSDNDKGANTRFIEINEAYDTLSDKDKKREYDLVTSEYKRKENLRKRINMKEKSWERVPGGKSGTGGGSNSQPPPRSEGSISDDPFACTWDPERTPRERSDSPEKPINDGELGIVIGGFLAVSVTLALLISKFY